MGICKYKSIGTHWMDLYVNDNNRRASYDAISFDRFGVEHIATEIKKFIRSKNIITNIYRIQPYNSIMCRYFCFEFIDFMLKGKSFLHYTNLFSPNDYEMNDKIILKYFQISNIFKYFCVVCSKYGKFEKPEISNFLEKTLVPSIICGKCKNEDEILFQEEESIEILNILVLIENI